MFPAIDWLLAAHKADGSWSADRAIPGSIEETALAVEALARCVKLAPEEQVIKAAINSGVAWLIERTQEGKMFEAAPIGLYFARLWYYEQLYPLIFTVAALESARNIVRQD